MIPSETSRIALSREVSVRGPDSRACRARWHPCIHQRKSSTPSTYARQQRVLQGESLRLLETPLHVRRSFPHPHVATALLVIATL